MNILNKKLLIFTGILLALAVFPAERSFASNLLTIDVNDIKVTITRDLGGENETYTINTSDLLGSFSLEFDDDNKVSLKKTTTGGVSWDVQLMYRGISYSGNVGSSMSVIEVNDDNINVTITVQALSEDSVSFLISKDLSDNIFNKILVNRSPFTLTAESTGNKIIKVERKNSSGEDSYTFTANEALKLENVEVSDGTDNIKINYNNNNQNYTVSGQYKNIDKSLTVAVGSQQIVQYNDIKVAVLISQDKQSITLSSDPATIEMVARKILDDKRNITEKAIANDEVFEIPSNSNLATIHATGQGGKVKFVTADNASSVNKEITINYGDNKVIFPEETIIKGPSGWDGKMSLPKIVDEPTVPTISGYSVTVEQAITIGGDGDFEFDKPVQLIFSGYSGKKVGFIKKGGVFTGIEACSDGILSGKQDCKYDSGSDLIVLTKHFTEFVVFSATSISNIQHNIQGNQVVITFDVSSFAPGILMYRTAQGGSYTTLHSDEETSHSFTLTGLDNTTYYYKVGYEVGTSQYTSSEYSFTLQAEEITPQGGTGGGAVVPIPPATPQEEQTVKGDLNNNSMVDEYDFSLLMVNWGKTGENPCDLNGDKAVDEYDFSLLMANWTI